MGTSLRKRALEQYRERLRQRGMARFQVIGRETDRELIRELARRLAGEEPEASRIRAAIYAVVAGARGKRGGILAALRKSPLVGADVDLARPKTPSRNVTL